jgi:hypothetical protein
MKETHTCDQEVSIAGVLTSSICHEMHLLRPFSKENSGATTEVTQKMTFVKERAGTISHLGKVLKCLIISFKIYKTYILLALRL